MAETEGIFQTLLQGLGWALLFTLGLVGNAMIALLLATQTVAFFIHTWDPLDKSSLLCVPLPEKEPPQALFPLSLAILFADFIVTVVLTEKYKDTSVVALMFASILSIAIFVFIIQAILSVLYRCADLLRWIAQRRQAKPVTGDSEAQVPLNAEDHELDDATSATSEATLTNKEELGKN